MNKRTDPSTLAPQADSPFSTPFDGGPVDADMAPSLDWDDQAAQFGGDHGAVNHGFEEPDAPSDVSHSVLEVSDASDASPDAEHQAREAAYAAMAATPSVSASATPKPFALFDDDDDSPVVAPVAAAARPAAPKSPEQKPKEQTQPQPQAAAERPRAEQSTTYSPAYRAPNIGTTSPLAEVIHHDLESVQAGKALAVDAKPVFASSKVKLAVVATFAVAALVIGAFAFMPKSGPTAPLAVPTPTAPVPAPTALPTVPTVAPTPTAPGVGIDIGNTKAIALETGDIDMVEQGRPIAPAAQSCASNTMSEYSQAVCRGAGQAKYFQCAPDGYHWDPRIPGCAQL